MPSEVDIVNVALRMVGGTRITSLSEGIPNSNKAEDIYTEVRDDLLEYPWNFATKRVKLAQDSTAPVFEYDNAYPLPSDWIMTVSVHGDDSGLTVIDYKEETIDDDTRVILADHDDVWLRYIFRVTDPNMMSSGFRKALELALARELAIPVANSGTLHDRLSIRADRQLAKARSVDSKNSPPEQRPLGSWLTRRSSGYRLGSYWIK